jgi:hypothetical protein
LTFAYNKRWLSTSVRGSKRDRTIYLFARFVYVGHCDVRLGVVLSAAGALIAVATQCSSAATRDRQQHLLMLTANPLATALDEAMPCIANDVTRLRDISRLMDNLISQMCE